MRNAPQKQLKGMKAYFGSWFRRASFCLDKEGMGTAQGLAGGIWGKAVHITAYQKADIITQMVGLKDLLTVTYFLKLAPLLMVPQPP